MKRALSLFLALVLCFSTLTPVLAIAEPGDEEILGNPVDEEPLGDPGEQSAPPLFEFINISGVGAAYMEDWVTGAWAEEQEGMDEMQYMSPEGFKTRLMVRAMGLDRSQHEEGYTPAYYALLGDDAEHELTLYSYTKLDTARITLTGATVSDDGFTELVYGNGTSERGKTVLYRYVAGVTLPAQDGTIGLYYDGVKQDELPLYHVRGESPVPLVGTMWIEDYEEDFDYDAERDEEISLIRSITLRISGFYLPWKAEGYALSIATEQVVPDDEGDGTHIEFVYAPKTASTVTKEDKYGYRLVTFDFGDGIPGMELRPDVHFLLENGDKTDEISAFFFDPDAHLINNDEIVNTFRTDYSLDDDPYWMLGGYNVSVLCPYYCINMPEPVKGEAPEVMPELVIIGAEMRGDGVFSTQNSSVDVYEKAGSYDGGLWRLSFDNGAHWAEWYEASANTEGTNARYAAPFAKSGKYGDYTIRAQFKKDGLRTTTLKYTINYNDGKAPQPTDPRILDAAAGEAVAPNSRKQYVLRGAADKEFTFAADGPAGMTVKLCFKEYDKTADAYSQIGKAVSMTYNTTAKRYEVTLEKSDIPTEAWIAAFRTEEAPGYVEPSKETTLEIVNMEPLVFKALAPTYPAQRRVDSAGKPFESVQPGDQIECLFNASDGPGWTRETTLTYKTQGGATKTLTAVPAKYGANSYKATFTVPDDAAQLGTYTCTLLEGGQVAEKATFDLSACRVVADVTLTGIPANYKGVRLILKKGTSEQTFVFTGETGMILGDLTPGSYTWELEGKSGHIAKGSFTVTRGATLTLPSLPALGSLTVTTAGFTSSVNGKTVLPEATVVLDLTTPDGTKETLTAAPGTKREEIPVGTTGTVSLTWDTAAYEEVSDYTPKNPSVTVNGDETVALTFKPFTMRTVSGKLYGKYTGDKAWGTVIVLTQEITRGTKTETYTKTATVSSAGGINTDWSFQCYDDVDAKIEFRSLTWSHDPITVTASGDYVVKDEGKNAVYMQTGAEKLIQVKANANLPSYLSVDADSKVTTMAAASTEPVPLDSSFLNVSTVESGGYYGKDYFDTFTADGQLWLKLKEGVVKANTDIYVSATGSQEYGALTFKVNGGQSWSTQRKKVNYDAGSDTATVTFDAAMSGGELRSTVVADPDSGMTGFLMYFSQNAAGGVTCNYVCGTGELHLPYSSGGSNHTVMSLMTRTEDVSAMAEVLRATPEVILNQIPKDKIEKLVMKTSTTKKYCFRENVGLQSNAYMYLEDMSPNVYVGAEILPPYSFSYDVSLTNEPSTLLVTGTLTKRFPDVFNGDAIKGLHVYVLDPNTGEAVANATDSVTVNGKHGYNGIFSYTYHDDVIQFNAPLTNYNDLRFKVVLDIGSRGSTIRDRQITYAYNDKITMFSLSGPTTIYLADQLAAQGLSENAHDSHYDAKNWTLRLSLRSFGSRNAKEAPITIWDNGVAIWQGNYGWSDYFWPIDVRLNDNLTPGIHVLWATRYYNDEEISTEPLVVNLMSGSENNAVHVTDFTWIHYNSRTATSSTEGDYMHFNNLSELAGQTIWLWPGKRTDMRFRVNNATSKDLKGVTVRFYGVRARGRFVDNITADIPCTWLYDDASGNYSYWEFKNANMGYFYTFEILYDYKPAALSELSHTATDEERRVAELEAGYEACGLGEVPDDTQMVEALKTATSEQIKESMAEGSQYLPSALSGLNLTVTQNTSSKYEVKLPKSAATDKIKDYSLTVTSGGQVASHEIYALMEKERAEGSQDAKEPKADGWKVYWAELDGIQGSTLIRMAVQNKKLSNGTYALTMHRTAYITAEVADAITQGKSIGQAVNQSPRPLGAPSTGLYDGGDPPAHWIKNRYDEVSYINSVGDIAQDLYVAAVKDTYTNAAEAAKAGKDAKFMPKNAGNVMNVLGVADAAISITSGPSGKDSMGLYMLLSNVKDQKFRAQIESQLRDYDQLRMDIYAQDTAMSAVSAGASFAPDPTPLTKIVVFLGGIGNSTISGWSKDYNRQVYNTTLMDIQRQIRFEKYKEMRAVMDDEFKKMVARRFGEDVANNERLLMEEKKHWVLATDEFGDPKWRLRENVPDYNTYQDPSGYVFEAVEENRLDGVTATLYYSPTVDGAYTVWHDPASEPQLNPQNTNEEGRYQWMVPEGWWKVRYEKDGYLVAESRPMEVPPVHTAVNIGMLSTEAPTVAIKENGDGYAVMFSKYMQVESLVKNEEDYSADSFDAASFAIRFLDENGDPVPGTVTFSDKVANTGYKGDGYGTDVIPSEWFARNAVFTPQRGYEVKSWVLGKGMVSYAGVALDGETADLYLIHLDGDGGDVSMEDLVTDTAGKLTRLPDPYREGYTFLGWYDEDENKVTLETEFTDDATITARWEVFGGYLMEAEQPEDAPLTITFTNNTDEEDEVTCLCAVYDANGRMVRVQSTALTTGEKELTPTTTDGACLRTFCCDADYIPLARPFYLRFQTAQ